MIEKSRNWAFVMYPDSAPDNWFEVLSGLAMKILVSPLHDSDVNADGEIKKAHWHVLLIFDGGVTQKRANQISELVSGTVCQKCASLRGYARYLCHMDNPEKAQYSQREVLCLGDVDYLELVSSVADVDSAVMQIEDWIDENQCISYAALCRYCRRERPDWYRLLRTRCTVHITQYLKSCAYERHLSS